MIGVDGMEMPKRKYFAMIAVAGFVIAFIEPIILLLLGDDLGGAFWPMAIRTLELTLYLRENRSLVFALTIILTLTALVYNRSENPISIMVATFSVGLVFGLLAVFKLLDMAYMRGAFILLPTLYGFLILILSFKLYGIPKNILKSNKKRISIICNYILVIFAIFLITPGLQAISGLAPHPPELDMPASNYSIEVTRYEYPMPEEVQKIRGDIEGDIDFSIYLAEPDVDSSKEIPLAIILHGFANPGYSSYTDWVETLAGRGIYVAYIQYPSDVWPDGHDTYELHEEAGMSNHPFHVPRTVAIYSALEYLEELVDGKVNTDFLLVGGHSLGAGYSFIVLDWALERGWGSDSLVVDLEAPYARPVQEDLQPNLSSIPENFIAHVAVSEDDMSVSDCFGVHHQQLLGPKALLLEIPSDRHGFPRLVASHYLQATETHDTLADWGFYRRVVNQGNWLFSMANNDTSEADLAFETLQNNDDSRYMGEWSDGKSVKQIEIYEDAINSPQFEYCSTWTGP